jgi:hypothetical protein
VRFDHVARFRYRRAALFFLGAAFPFPAAIFQKLRAKRRDQRLELKASYRVWGNMAQRSVWLEHFQEWQGFRKWIGIAVVAFLHIAQPITRILGILSKSSQTFSNGGNGSP